VTASSSSRQPGLGPITGLDRALDDPRVFQAVQEYLVALEAGERPEPEEFLDRHPEIRESLTECLEALQFVHTAAERSLPSTRRLPDLPGVEPPTAVPLGDFQLLREIGRGGMGVVYEAIQLSLGRRVALKILPFAAALDARHLQRFKNEASAAAFLHHPNIVPVYGVGYDRGTHFYAMQLIEGITISALIRQLRRDAGRGDSDPESKNGAIPPKRRRVVHGGLTQFFADSQLGSPPPAMAEASGDVQPVVELSTARSKDARKYFRTVARLGVDAAAALEHAHQTGVIHRDVKPGNLMLDCRGHLWITDFGLAQFHMDPGLTVTGDLVGTLRYMSPEQAMGQRLQLDHRTDVYSLGVTLYELLTLEPAFPGGDRQELLHRIATEEPIVPRLADPNIPAELDTIVLKAISKSRVDRYATAQALADDLQRFLDEKPILARRPSQLDRARKWCRRHPSAVVSGVLGLLVMIAGLLLYTWMLAREEARARLERERAENRYKDARQAVDLLVQVSEDELDDKPPLSGLRRRLLETALVSYQRFMEQHPDDPELAAVQARVRGILEELSVLQGAFRTELLSEPAVLRDLTLTSEQRERISGLTGRWSEQFLDTFQGFDRIAPEERHRRFLEVARERDRTLREVLTWQQLQRLKQLSIQAQGFHAFHDSEVQEMLKLTPRQKSLIHEIEDEIFGRPPGGPGRGPPGRPHREPPGDRQFGDREERAQAAVAGVKAILTPEQLRRWNDLAGEPCEGLRPAQPPWLREPPPSGPRGR
jgi:serine/threonine protein kinase